MRPYALQAKRLRPWLRATLAVYLLCTVAFATVHQHQGGVQNSDCALCTLAHTPAVAAPATQQPEDPSAARPLVEIVDDVERESDAWRASRPRAPPRS